MASQNKTTENEASVSDFLAAIDDETKRADSEQLVAWMEEATGQPARMWGKSIVGFGSYHYQYDSGREGDFMRVGFSPRKREISLYIMPGFSGYEELLGRLGKHRTGKSCLYIRRLANVDTDVLQELIQASVDEMARRYPEERDPEGA